jgi:maleate cis-trans isomerase
MQTIMRLPGFGYTHDEFIAAVPEIGVSFRALVAAGTEVVAQFGYPFSLVHGWEGAQKIQANIENDSGACLVMMGVEVVKAIKHLGCESLAVASTYYSDKTAKVLQNYLEEAGLEILSLQNWESQGMAEGNNGMFAGTGELDPMAWRTPLETLAKAIRDTAKGASKADGILVSGGGMRVLDIVENLETATGKPIVGGDIAIYWGLLRRLGIKKDIRGHGRLLASLSRSIDVEL